MSPVAGAADHATAFSAAGRAALVFGAAGRAALGAKSRRAALASISLAFALSACGYSWQTRNNPWKSQGIEKVYINIMTNNSLRAGAEVPFTSAFVKAFSRGNKVRVVSRPEDADAVVDAVLDSVSASISSSTTVPSLTADIAATDLSDMVIATEYVAKANVTVNLVRRSDGTQLISQSFDRVKVFPGNNRFGLPGTTSVLINDSQQQLALNEIAQVIASDAYDTILEAF
ncbi:MAG: hypothetical protein HYW49_08280 [Deltaproteobacteria bacterium]|nr:hypothetical protein [Deltaproteobacteria bacterium]